MKIATAQEMAELDRLAAEEYGLPTAILMENAGQCVAEAAVRLLGEAAGRRVAVVCGKGNNGGDGLVAARVLHGLGAHVLACVLGSYEDLKADTRDNLRRAASAGVAVEELRAPADLARALPALRGVDLLVDAVFGTGFRPPAVGFAATLIAAVNDLGARVLAVDIPSGLSADHGPVDGPAIGAVATVTFGLPKPALLLHPAARKVGRLWVADIGFPPGIEARLGVSRNLLTPPEARALLRPRDPESHKGTAGHVLLVAGSRGLAGAAVLAARGALRAGAGLVTVGLPASQATPTLAALPEAMTLPLPETGRGSLAAGAAAELLAHLPGKRAVAIGPGLSRDPETVGLVRDLLPRIPVPLVLDADALAALPGQPAALLGENPGAVITPHPGELARLLGLTTAEVQADRVEVARSCARTCGATVVLKGARTVVATPAGTVYLNLTGNPGMAAGGMGDVLTGVIASLLAQGHDALTAAVLGVFLHGLAADRAASRRPWGYLAGEVADLVPHALGSLLRCRPDDTPRAGSLSLIVP